MPALDGLTVVDLTEGIAGPYCSLLLAGLGAQVTKIEPPRGDFARRLPPFANDQADDERSLVFLHLNRGKRGTVLNPASESDRARLQRLLMAADVLLYDGDPDSEDWGIDTEAIRRERPRVVACRLVGTGTPGPLAGWRTTELIIGALSGLMSCTGEPDREPLKTGGHVALLAQGQTAFTGVLAAYLRAQRGEGGAVVEVSALEANADLLEMWAFGAFRSKPMRRLGRHHQTLYPFEVYPARDGYVGVHAQPGTWQDFADLLEAPQLLDASLQTPTRIAHRDEIDRVIIDWLANRGKLEAYHAAQARRFAFGYVADSRDLLSSSHLQTRGFFRRIEHPTATTFYPGPPFRLDSGWRDGRAPLLGEHDDLLSKSMLEEAPSRQEAKRQTLPLAGVRVLDLTQIWAGPRATKVLADLGADVIKIESHARTDSTRGYARLLEQKRQHPDEDVSEREHNRSSQFEQLHRGKRSILLNLTLSPDREAFLKLVALSDVVIANFAYGVLERLGIDHPNLREINPRIIVVSMTGFGDSGPERDYVAYGVTQEELSGIYSITGYPGEGPCKSGTNVGDPMNGMHAAGAVIAALAERERTGRGQYIEMSQMESSVGLTSEYILDYQLSGRVQGPVGNKHPLWVPHGVYPCRGEDAWVAIAVRSDEEWRATAELLRLPQTEDLAAVAGRRMAQDGLDEAIGQRTRRWNREDLAGQLQARGVPAAPVFNSVEVRSSEHLRARGYVVELTHSDGGKYSYFGPLWTFDGKRPTLRAPAPLLGQDNEHVLFGLAHLTREQVSSIDG